MDHSELLVAHAVRTLAETLRSAAHAAVEQEQTFPNGTERMLARRSWYQQHPLSEFLPRAYRELKDVAALIKSLEP